jgi:hypothetical protein
MRIWPIKLGKGVAPRIVVEITSNLEFSRSCFLRGRFPDSISLQFVKFLVQNFDSLNQPPHVY